MFRPLPLFFVQIAGSKIDKYLLTLQIQFSAGLVDSTLINTFFINKDGFFGLYCTPKISTTKNINETLMIKSVQMTFSAFWVSWSHLQHLSSAWVFGHRRQLHNSWEHLRVCKVTQAFCWELLSVSIRAGNDPSVFTITKKAPTKGFSWLKTPTTGLTHV